MRQSSVNQLATAVVVIGATAIAGFGQQRPARNLPSYRQPTYATTQPSGSAVGTDSSTSAAGGVASASSLPSQYSILLTRSLFARDHRSATDPNRSRDARRPTKSPEASWVYEGAMNEDGIIVAVVENVDDRKVLWLRDGDAVPGLGGRVVDITFEQITHETGKKRTTVAIGQNFEGGSAALPSASSSTPATASSTPAGSGSSIEEMMRQRRQREGVPR